MIGFRFDRVICESEPGLFKTKLSYEIRHKQQTPLGAEYYNDRAFSGLNCRCSIKRVGYYLFSISTIYSVFKLMIMEELFDYQNNLKAIKSQLLRGWRVTVKSVLQSIGTQEARHYIAKLRRDPDLEIKDRWVSKDGKRFKEYFVEKAA